MSLMISDDGTLHASAQHLLENFVRLAAAERHQRLESWAPSQERRAPSIHTYRWKGRRSTFQGCYWGPSGGVLVALVGTPGPESRSMTSDMGRGPRVKSHIYLSSIYLSIYLSILSILSIYLSVRGQ
jgi:hypothetical protein